jgi:hypothetical protein
VVLNGSTLDPSSERAICVPAFAGNLYFFFPGIATGLTAVFLIVRNHTDTRFVCAPFCFVFSHNLLLHLILANELFDPSVDFQPR